MLVSFELDGQAIVTDEPVQPTFRAWLQQAMKDRAVGIRQVEKYAGVSRSALSQILRGETLPSMESVRKLAGYFGSNAERLMSLVYAEKYAEKAGELSEAGTATDIDLNDPTLNIQLWLDAHRELTPEELDSIKALIRHDLERRRRQGGVE